MQRIHAMPELTLTAATRNHAVMGVAAQGSSGVGVVSLHCLSLYGGEKQHRRSCRGAIMSGISEKPILQFRGPRKHDSRAWEEFVRWQPFPSVLYSPGLTKMISRRDMPFMKNRPLRPQNLSVSPFAIPITSGYQA